MSDIIYFDNSATTIPCEAALNAANKAVSVFGNPSSTHFCGLEAKRLLESSREELAGIIGARENEVFFTASGSESNNTAISGAAKLKARHSKTIVTTDSEHPSVNEPVSALEKEGYKIIRLSTKGGMIDESELKEALSEKVALVSVMHVNNETGAVYDLKMIRSAIESSKCGALFHSDDVQGFMKTGIPATRFADIVTASAHKINGIRGAGLLYVRNGIKLPPYILGGGQEKGMRSGTENTAAIAAFAAAASDWKNDKTRVERISSLRAYIKETLFNSFGGAISFNEPVSPVCSVLSISLIPLKSEVALNALSAERICVSASSACSSKKKHNSVLASFGLTDKEAESTLRIGISYMNTKEEAEALVHTLKNVYDKCVK
ncbi:MAG: aminotransferase class V-fold PLP-dependent enzyme [Clostridia bacterium]|nr:aminotransferase class V-fold PLP-dependent enzyme [Clostridia bacterium]